MNVTCATVKRHFTRMTVIVLFVFYVPIDADVPDTTQKCTKRQVLRPKSDEYSAKKRMR